MASYADVALVFRILLAAVLVLAGISKLKAVANFRAALRQFRILPPFVVDPVSRVLPIAELAVGAGILSGVEPYLFGSVAAALLGLFTLAIVVTLLRGDHLRCSCFGSLAAERLTWLSVARNLVLVFGAFFIAGYPRLERADRVLVPALDDFVPAALIAVAVVFMYVATIRALGLEASPAESSGHGDLERSTNSAQVEVVGE